MAYGDGKKMRQIEKLVCNENPKYDGSCGARNKRSEHRDVLEAHAKASQVGGNWYTLVATARPVRR